MNKIEYIDVYDENKIRTGNKKIRYQDMFNDGEFAVGVQAMIINSKGEILITQRSENCRVLPLKWECNGGAVLAGEDFLDALTREICEEMGLLLNKEDAIFLKSVKRENHFKEIYLFKRDVLLEELNFSDGEALAGKWVSIDEFMKMFNDGDIVHSVNIDRKDYEKCLKLLNIK